MRKLRDSEERRGEDSGRRRSEEGTERDGTRRRRPGRRRARNREYTLVSVFFVLIFVSLIGYLIYYNVALSQDFINSPYNTRQDTFADRVVRGDIVSSEGEVLATTSVSEDGTETRVYSYSNMFAHVVGYDSNGKSGLESEANYSLLSSHSFFLEQIQNELQGDKNQGDTVVSSLSVTLQSAAYNALGSYNGAVIVMEPSTGRILAMVSKPDFDPNTISTEYSALVSDENNSSLLNRATNGAYPPGSTFKVVVALDYFRTYGSLEGFSYLCEGSITVDEHTISCYNGNVHGQEDLYSAFAYSCNCAFAEIGLSLGGDSLKDTAEDLLFNQSLPLTSYRTSTFSADSSSASALLMQTSIGQGDTLVSPMHMALITCAIANDGILMQPTLIDQVVSSDGDVVDTTEAEVYKRLMTSNEANVLGELMKDVVEYGTATGLSGRGYTVAGKTGSAEYDEQGSSHSWFIGYSNVDDPDLVVAVIAEGGGTGSQTAVPIAAAVFDAYYSSYSG